MSVANSDETIVTPESAENNIEPANPAPADKPKEAPSDKPKEAPSDKPEWLDARLEQHSRRILKQLGVESLEEAKKAVDKAREAEDALKSDAQKRGELEAVLKSERAEKQALTEVIETYAKVQMSGLTDEQRNAVTAVAGDDPAKQLKTIEALKPTWASAANPANLPAPPPPEDTAPKPGAPKGNDPAGEPDPKAVYETLNEQNPILAARYALANGLFDK